MLCIDKLIVEWVLFLQVVYIFSITLYYCTTSVSNGSKSGHFFLQYPANRAETKLRLGGEREKITEFGRDFDDRVCPPLVLVQTIFFPVAAANIRG